MGKFLVVDILSVNSLDFLVVSLTAMTMGFMCSSNFVLNLG